MGTRLTFAHFVSFAAITAAALWLTAPKAPAQVEATPQGARQACAEFLERRAPGMDLQHVHRQDWRVFVEGGRWIVRAEYRVNHGGGASTLYRTRCTLRDAGETWQLVGLG